MYIEFVIVDNFLLTYLAAAAATRICRNKLCIWRLCIGAAIGTGVAVCYPFISGGVAVQLAVKLGLWVVLCFVMFFGAPRFLAASVVFLLCTFAFGGAVYAVELLLVGSEKIGEFTRKVPLFLGLGCGVCFYAAVRVLARRIRLARVRAPYEYGTEVVVWNSRLKFAAFLDTGNCVYDSRSGLPVVITDVDIFTDKLDGAAAVKFAKALPRLRKITAKTPAGETEIYLIQPTEITVYSDRHAHKINAMIGLVVGQGRRFSETHEMLLGPEAVTEGV